MAIKTYEIAQKTNLSTLHYQKSCRMSTEVWSNVACKSDSFNV